MDKIQKEIDIKKWLESEEVNLDLCGTYPFCKYCNKELENPCSHAIKKMNEVEKEEKEKDNEVNVVKKKKKYKRLTFKEKLNKAKQETKDELNEVVNIIESINLTTKIHKRFLSITYRHRLCGWISLTRNSLKIHLPIDPTTYLEYKPLDYSDKKTYIKNPYTLKLNTKRSKKAIRVLLLQIIKNIDLEKK